MKKRYSIPIGISVGFVFLLIAGMAIQTMDSMVMTVKDETGNEQSFFVNPTFDCAKVYDAQFNQEWQYEETKERRVEGALNNQLAWGEFLKNRCVYSINSWSNEAQHSDQIYSNGRYALQVLTTEQQGMDQMSQAEYEQTKQQIIKKYEDMLK